jgi:sugar lactone lactonase YvrE
MKPASILVDLSSPEDRFLPEGPRVIQLKGREALAWVNIQRSATATAGDIHVLYTDKQEHQVFPQEKRPGFILPTDRENTLFVGMEKQIGTIDLNDNQFVPLATIEDESTRTIINDGEVLPGGHAILFGTKDLQFSEPIGHLYLYNLEDRSLRVVADGQTCSNGKVIHAAQSGFTVYDIDTPTRQVREYHLDVAAGKLQYQRTAIDLGKLPGFPDGMVDAGDDSVIVAIYQSAVTPNGAAHRFSLKTGELIESWEIPGSPRVTCPLIWERQGQVKLVVTTADEGMAPEVAAVAPHAGSLFIADTSLKSIPATEFVRLKS